MCRMQYLARYHSTTVRETFVRKRFEATGPDAIPAMLLKDPPLHAYLLMTASSGTSTHQLTQINCKMPSTGCISGRQTG